MHVSESATKVANTVGAYSDPNNYWAPLSQNDDNDAETIPNISSKERIRKCIENFYCMRGRPMVVDSGATSTFVQPEEN